MRPDAPGMRAVFFLALSVCIALLGCLAAYGAQPQPEARIHVEYFRQAQKALALVRLELPAGSYAYAHEPGAAVKPAVLALRDEQGRPVPVLYPVGKEIRSPGVNGPVRVYVSGDTLFVPLDASAKSVLTGELSLALCTAEHCVFPELDVVLRIPEGGLPELDAGTLAEAYAAARPGRIAPDTGPASAVAGSLPLLSLSGQAADGPPAGQAQLPRQPDAWQFQPRAFQASLEVGGLAAALFFGLLAGLVLNVMPCVLPVLTLKAGALLQVSGADQATRAHRLREHMLLFAAGILSWFWLLALLLGGSGLIWGQLFQHSVLTYGLLALVFTLGLSMLGVFNLPFVDMKAGATGSPRLQAYFAGFLATLLATPCSGPLLGGVLAWAFSRDAFTLGLVFSAVGLGMALPYLFFALRPELARFLPRPGPWLEVLERLVGFFLMGLTVYLIFLLPEERRMPALASLPLIALAVWIWGAYCGPGVFARRRRILGGMTLGLLAAAVLLGLHATAAGRAEWEDFTSREFRALLGKQPQVLVFTADWCPNCKVLEYAVLGAKQVNAWQKRYGARFVRVDLTRENAPALALLRALGSSSIPFAAFFPAGEAARTPLVLRDMYTSRQFGEALERGFAKP
jgi:thiol:disulfide interchange protein DsbD